MRQMSRTRRRLAAGAFLIVAGPVALGSVAYACQSLATLHANPSSAAAGGAVTLFGKNYSSNATSTNIEIHLDARDGLVIASFAPTSVLNGTATIPAGTAAGTHTLVATQFTSTGNAVSGTPGRATVSVTVAGRSSADGVSAPAATSSDPAAATPTAATPATPAAPAAVSSLAPAQAVAAPSAPAAAGAAAPAAPAANVASTPAAQAASAATAAPVVSAPDAAAPAASAAPASVNVGLLPASAESASILPGLTLVAGMSLVLLGLVAFLKSVRGRSFSPLAG